eukprot:CAMPEP_0198290510 /NCGR_PEP_ID=MMETSP1449-20131203/8347_1 /TAXON_ID=420275 /ORGANISM="Attheya septentrionalis, Strain CCMP2084" /LENGTH=272 /DNA_ID=CAMNT_0043989019 /DNA_START=82 /DNA_END=900 /DNA_ORIENTATION=+
MSSMGAAGGALGSVDSEDDLQFAMSVDMNRGQNVPVPIQKQFSEQHFSGQMQTEAEAEAAGAPKPQFFSESAHPVACLFHLLFKSLALLLYIFGGWFKGTSDTFRGANFITVTVCCILLLAADFWVVKNVTGRLLVGLRWWNQVSPDGSNTRWIFESASVQNVNKFDNSTFWTVLYATPAVWGFLLGIGILKLEIGWLITVAIALALNGANLYGYYKCSSDQKHKFQAMVARGAQMGAMAAIRNNIFGVITRVAAGTPATNTSQPPSSDTYV